MDDFPFEIEVTKKSQHGKNQPYVDTSNLSIQDALKQIIDTYLKENPHLKIECLANGDIGRTTIYNFLRLFPKKKLEAESILGLMRSVHNELSLLKISKIYDGKFGDFLKKSVLHFDDHSKDQYASPVMEKRLKSSDTFLIFLLASPEQGVSIEELNKGYGSTFIRRVEKYVEKGELVKKNGRIYLKNKIEDTSINLKSTFVLAKNLINGNFKLDNCGDDDKNNILHLLFGMVNPDHPAIKEKLPAFNKQYIKDIRNIFKEAEGDQPLWLALLGDWLLDFLLKKPENDNYKGELH